MGLVSGVPAVTIPGIIVGITAGLSFESYTHRNYCFLSGNVVYYAFLGPLGKPNFKILTVNIIIFLCARC